MTNYKSQMTNSYKLRKATNDDLWLSYDIRKNALGKYVDQTWGWDEEWQLEYHKKDFDISIMQIIESEGKAVGTLELVHEDDAVKISGIYIIDKYQSGGIGAKIMNDILSNYKDKEIRLQVLKVNPRAKGFYERLGFKVTSEEKHHYKMVFERVTL